MKVYLNQECNEGLRKRHRGSSLQGLSLCGHQNLWHKCWGWRQTKRNWNKLKIFWGKMTNWDTMKNTETTRDKLTQNEKLRQTMTMWDEPAQKETKESFFTLGLFSGNAIAVGVPSWSHRGNRHGRWPLGGKVFKWVWFWFEMLSSDPL